MLRTLTLFLIAIPAFCQTFDLSNSIGGSPGKAEFLNNEYRITGSGANIWAREDAFYFASHRISGDFTLTADIQFTGEGVNPHRKAVLMARQDLSPGSPYADAALHGDGLTSLQFRLTANETTAETKSTISGAVRLRLVRQGNRFTMFAGKPGEELVATGPQTIELKDPVYVGLGVSSHDAAVNETAVFSNVQLQQPRRYRSKITIFDLKTRHTRTVYQADQVIEAPNWSRDGKWLLINTGGDLYRLPVDGEPKLEKIALGEGGYRCNNDHDLSPDGSRIAFSASSPKSRQSQVYTASADGTGVRLMTPLSPSYFHGWSPDGKHLAYVGQRAGEFHLFRVASNGGDEERLTRAGSYDDGPEYSRDGKWIYFNSNRSGGWDIWRIPADGGGAEDSKAERVTSDEWEDWFPHFSPDAKHLLVFSFPKGTAGHNDRMEGVALRIMAAPGRKLRAAKPKTLITFFGGQGTINVNSWSPDSKRFAYVVYEPLPPVQ